MAKKLLIEGDSMNTIDCQRGKVNLSWKVTSILQDNLQLLESFEEYEASHFLREGNRTAD